MINFMSFFDRWANKHPYLASACATGFAFVLVCAMILGVATWDKKSLREYRATLKVCPTCKTLVPPEALKK